MTGKTRRTRVLWSLLLLFALGISGCAQQSEPGGDASPAPDGPPIVVGSADFTESQILGEIYAQALEHAGYPVERKLGVGARELYYPALESGEISLVPEYVEAIYRHVTGEDGPDDREQILTDLNEALEPKGLQALEPAEAENRDGQAVTKETAEEHGLEKVSDLEGEAKDMVFAGPPECPERPACLKGLQEEYGLTFESFRPLDGGPRYAAVAAGEVDVIQVFTTDGPIAQYELVVLEDDKGIAGDQRIIPVIRTDIVEEHGEDLVELINSVTDELDTETLSDLNKQVDVDREDPETVATEWLDANGFLS